MEISHPGLMWLSIGVLLFVMEMAVPGFVLFFFGLAAIITAAGSYLLNWSLNIQLAVFLAASLISLFGLRSLIKKVLMGDKIDQGEDSILAKGGEHCVVSVAITPPGEGQVKFAGTFWRAEADEPIEEGTVVEVVQQKDLLIRVKRVQL